MASSFDIAENKPDTKPILTQIFYSNFLMQLHDVAANHSDCKKYNILNSMVYKNGSKLVYRGSGQQVLLISPTDGKIDVDDIVKALKSYVFVFTGIKYNITESHLNPLYDNSNVSESGVFLAKKYVPLLTEDTSDILYKKLFNNYLTEVKVGEIKRDDEQTNADESGKKITGYFVKFSSSSGSSKDTTQIKDYTSLMKQFKKTISDAIKGVSVATFHWRTGTYGDGVSLGSIMNAMSTKIDAKKLPDSFKEQFRIKFPNMNFDASVEKSKIIASYLRSRNYKADDDKLKNDKYKLSFLVKIYKDDKGYETIHKTTIAKILNKSIERGTVATILRVNHFKENDIILINNYIDNKRDKTLNDFAGAKPNSRQRTYTTEQWNSIVRGVDATVFETPECKEKVKACVHCLNYLYNRQDIQNFKRIPNTKDLKDNNIITPSWTYNLDPVSLSFSTVITYTKSSDLTACVSNNEDDAIKEFIKNIEIYSSYFDTWIFDPTDSSNGTISKLATNIVTCANTVTPVPTDLTNWYTTLTELKNINPDVKNLTDKTKEVLFRTDVTSHHDIYEYIIQCQKDLYDYLKAKTKTNDLKKYVTDKESRTDLYIIPMENLEYDDDDVIIKPKTKHGNKK